MGNELYLGYYIGFAQTTVTTLVSSEHGVWFSTADLSAAFATTIFEAYPGNIMDPADIMNPAVSDYNPEKQSEMFTPLIALTDYMDQVHIHKNVRLVNCIKTFLFEVNAKTEFPIPSLEEKAPCFEMPHYFEMPAEEPLAGMDVKALVEVLLNKTLLPIKNTEEERMALVFAQADLALLALEVDGLDVTQSTTLKKQLAVLFLMESSDPELELARMNLLGRFLMRHSDFHGNKPLIDRLFTYLTTHLPKEPIADAVQ